MLVTTGKKQAIGLHIIFKKNIAKHLESTVNADICREVGKLPRSRNNTFRNYNEGLVKKH